MKILTLCFILLSLRGSAQKDSLVYFDNTNHTITWGPTEYRYVFPGVGEIVCIPSLDSIRLEGDTIALLKQLFFTYDVTPKGALQRALERESWYIREPMRKPKTINKRL